MEILKISSKSNPNSVAGAIAGLVKESNKAEIIKNCDGEEKEARKGRATIAEASKRARRGRQ